MNFIVSSDGAEPGAASIAALMIDWMRAAKSSMSSGDRGGRWSAWVSVGAANSSGS